jgi:hypothetical protein
MQQASPLLIEIRKLLKSPWDILWLDKRIMPYQIFEPQTTQILIQTLP